MYDSGRKNREKYLIHKSGNNIIENQETEEYDICQTIRELIEDGRQEGHLEKACELLGRSEDYEVLHQMLQK